jgi:hypothetical protein
LRSAILISFLSPPGKFNFYSIVEVLGRATSWVFLRYKYHSYTFLSPSNAGYEQLIRILKEELEDERITSIDLFIMIHGKPQKLIFYHSGMEKGKHFVDLSEIESDISRLDHLNKLNLVYSTACYGASHNPFFIRSGFKSSVGATGVNTNAATEYPLFCSLWIMGMSSTKAILFSQKGYRFFDIIAGFLKYKDCNSEKECAGETRILKSRTRGQALL